MDTVVFTDPKAIDYFTNNMILVKHNAEYDSISIDPETGDTTTTAIRTKLSQDLAVSAFPTMVLVDANGDEIDRIVGYRDIDDFLLTLNNYQNGIGTLGDLLSKAESSEDRPMFFEIADKYKYKSEPDDARVWYQRVIDGGDDRDSLSGEARMSMADMIRRAKDYEGAQAEFQKIMKDFEGASFAMDAEVWNAICLRQAGDTANAISAFEGYIKHFPESEDVEYAEGQIRKLKGLPPEE